MKSKRGDLVFSWLGGKGPLGEVTSFHHNLPTI